MAASRSAECNFRSIPLCLLLAVLFQNPEREGDIDQLLFKGYRADALLICLLPAQHPASSPCVTREPAGGSSVETQTQDSEKNSQNQMDKDDMRNALSHIFYSL